jgi:hypothetical protein
MWENIKFLSKYKDILVKTYVVCVNVDPIVYNLYLSQPSSNLQLNKKYFVEEIYEINGDIYFSINGKLEHTERFTSLNKNRIDKIKTIINV